MGKAQGVSAAGRANRRPNTAELRGVPANGRCQIGLASVGVLLFLFLALCATVTVAGEKTDKARSSEKVGAVAAKESGKTPDPTNSHAATKDPALPAQQVKPGDNLGALFPYSDFSFLAVGVPDPRIPRHRRQYEYVISAMVAGMAVESYSLDRYWFPWTDYEDTEDKAASASLQDCQTAVVEDGESSRALFERAVDLRCYGFLVFRRDGWRRPFGDREPSSVRVVYLLPESVTYGVPAFAVIGAFAHARNHLVPVSSQWTSVPRAAEGLWHSKCAADSPIPPAQGRLLIAGPAFSSSATSYAVALDRLAPSEASFCLLSYSATAASNERLFESVPNPGGIIHAALNANDDNKRDIVFKLATYFGFNSDEVLFFVEQSTFGDSVCPRTDKRCQLWGPNANVIIFNANIAEVRQRHALQMTEPMDGTSLTDLVMDPHLSRVLQLDDVAENGSEYPMSHQSPVTIAGSDLALRRQISRFRHSGTLPKLIAVAATDVRDRLYLISAIKEELPWAVAVDMESDILLSHPDFIAATRGAIMLGSAPIQLSRTVYAQSDIEVVLQDLVQNLTLYPDEGSGNGPKPVAQTSIIGRNGPRLVGYAPVEVPNAKPSSLTRLFWWLREHIGTILLAFGLFVLPPWRGLRSRLKFKLRLPLGRSARILRAISAVIAGLGLVLAATLAMYTAYYTLRNEKTDSLDHVLVFVLAGFAIWVVRRFVLMIACVKPDVASSGRGEPLQSRSRLAPLVRLLTITSWHLMRSTSGRGIVFGIGLGLLSAAMLSLNFIADARRVWARPEHEQYFLMDFSVREGLAVSVPFMGVIVMVLYAMVVASSTALLRVRTQPLWDIVARALDRKTGTIHDRDVHPLADGLLIAFAAPFAYLLFLAVPLGSSGLGAGYDMGFYVSLVATAVTALGALASLVGYLELLIARCDNVVRLARAQVRTPTDPIPLMGPWYVFGAVEPEFAYTPILATRRRPYPTEDEGLTAVRALRNCLVPAILDSKPVREALHELLLCDVTRFRALLFLALASCFSGVLLVYAFPVPRRDLLLLMNMVLMILTAIASAYATIRMERHPLFSRLLSDRDDSFKWSMPLVRSLAFPFILFAASILIAEVPGVKEWSGSYLGALLRLLGGGGH